MTRPLSSEITGPTELKLERELADFTNILHDIESLDDRKKKLWLEIYKNALTDRANSFVLFKQLTDIVDNKTSEYAIHARSLSNFIERMSAANAQLLKLAELISRAEQASEQIDPEDMFKRIRQ